MCPPVSVRVNLNQRDLLSAISLLTQLEPVEEREREGEEREGSELGWKVSDLSCVYLLRDFYCLETLGKSSMRKRERISIF